MKSFSHPNKKSPHSTSGHDEKGKRLERQEGERAAAPAPFGLRQWAEDIFTSGTPDWLSPSSCSGCLTQVDDDQGGDAGSVDRAAGSALRARDRSSLLDHDESTAAPSVGSGRLIPSGTTDSYASVVRRDIRKSARATDSPVNDEEGVEVPANQDCPLCLNNMSTFDILYPINCPIACGYNFCVNCMSSLLSSSREDYQVASDGSRHVKVKLNCPNCRADIAGIIEDVIRSRREALENDLELGAKKMPYISTTDLTLSTSHGNPVTDSAIVSTPRLKNRSSAPRNVYQRRINDLIKTIDSMATPTLIRDQVLAVHGQFARQDSTPPESSIDDTLSQNSSSSVEVQITATPLLATPNRSCSFERSLSPQVNTLATPSELRRVQSLQTPYSPPQLEYKKSSPKSVLDLSYSSVDLCSDDEGVQQNEKSKLKQAHSPLSHGKGAQGSKLCLEGINFTDGEGGFFSNTIDLDWCCYDVITEDSVVITNSTRQEAPSEGCGGYVDYSGIYHPCTKVVQQEEEQGVEGQVLDLEGPCQGCIFRQGMHDGSDGNKSDEEEEQLFYDSDPGQHFAIASWTLSRKPSSPSHSHNVSASFSASSATSRQRAKLGWRRRRKHRGKSNRGSNINSITSGQDNSYVKDGSAALQGAQQRVQVENLQRRHEDQQSYLYDYFSQHDNDSGNAMRTGFCRTKESDVGNYVEEALNSKWRLQWHVNITRSSRTSNQGHMPPVICDLWIERGYRRNRTEIVEPKLMWSQLNLHKSRQLQGSTIRPYRVSLFAVRRIFQISTVDDWEKMNEGHQMRTPLMQMMVKPNCLLVVRSSLGEDYLFEASCSQERDHIVHLMKMATARLVSHAVVGNGDLMIQEFFNQESVAGGINASLITNVDHE